MLYICHIACILENINWIIAFIVILLIRNTIIKCIKILNLKIKGIIIYVLDYNEKSKG